MTCELTSRLIIRSPTAWRSNAGSHKAVNTCTVASVLLRSVASAACAAAGVGSKHTRVRVRSASFWSRLPCEQPISTTSALFERRGK